MNERIKELAEEAGFIPGIMGLNRFTYFDTEKFAELIVKECSKVLTQHGAYFSGEGEPYHYAAHLIEDHFGVEE